jgi:hypothetical protein
MMLHDTVFSVAYAEMRIKNCKFSIATLFLAAIYKHYLYTSQPLFLLHTRIRQESEYGSAWFCIYKASRIRIYIGNTDLDPGAMILAKITTFFTLSLATNSFQKCFL